MALYPEEDALAKLLEKEAPLSYPANWRDERQQTPGKHPYPCFVSETSGGHKSLWKFQSHFVILELIDQKKILNWMKGTIREIKSLSHFPFYLLSVHWQEAIPYNTPLMHQLKNPRSYKTCFFLLCPFLTTPTFQFAHPQYITKSLLAAY